MIQLDLDLFVSPGERPEPMKLFIEQYQKLLSDFMGKKIKEVEDLFLPDDRKVFHPCVWAIYHNFFLPKFESEFD
jgi:hypothetical protein